MDPAARPLSAADPARPRDAVPGDDAPPGTPGTGDDLCPACQGSGRRDGQDCPECRGTGIVNKGVGGA